MEFGKGAYVSQTFSEMPTPFCAMPVTAPTKPGKLSDAKAGDKSKPTKGIEIEKTPLEKTWRNKVPDTVHTYGHTNTDSTDSADS